MSAAKRLLALQFPTPDTVRFMGEPVDASWERDDLLRLVAFMAVEHKKAERRETDRLFRGLCPARPTGVIIQP